ncbi:MAG: DnaB-like helicase C-terminal domain-containing protein [Deltaproteobacteria bacterium]|nr:DnaB-like helicase C-terminal domain-containing protein [Deltaproteobacteria bacterium]
MLKPENRAEVAALVRNAELSAISCGLQDSRTHSSLLSLVEDDFIDPAARAAYAALTRAVATGLWMPKRAGVDPAWIVADPSVRAYCTEIEESVLNPSPVNAAHYVGIIRRASVARQTVARARAYVESHERPGLPEDPGTFLEECRKLADRAAGESEVIDPAKAAQIVESDYDAHAARGTPYPGLPTGIPVLDELTGGLRPGRLWIIAARTSEGKSVLGLNIARHVGITVRKRCALLSYEMRGSEILGRLAADLGRFNSVNYQRGKLTATELARLNSARRQIAEGALDIIDRDPPRISRFETRVRSLHWKAPLALVVLDYLQLMRADSATKHQNREQIVADVSRRLKELAMATDIPIAAICQLNRNSTLRADKRPMASELRESGSLEQDADAILLLFRDREKPSTIEIDVAKNRGGRTSADVGGPIVLDFNGAESRIS